jgi:hypothetical protein
MYSIKNGVLVKDANGNISRKFYNYLQNPTIDYVYDPSYSPDSFNEASLYLGGTVFHKTNRYRNMANSLMVVRRGFPFVILKGKNYVDDLDDLSLVLVKRRAVHYKEYSKEQALKDEERWGDATYFSRYYTGNYASYDYDTSLIKILKRTKEYIIFYTEPDCPIGKYTITDFKNFKKSSKDIEFNSTLNINIIFNPYHKEDIVYYPNEKECDEYILNETGFFYQGDSIEAKNLYAWNYDQFNEYNLEMAMLMVPFAESLKDCDEKDLAQFVRTILFAVNKDIIKGLWLRKPLNDSDDTQIIFAYDDSSPADIEKKNVDKNFNIPHVPCYDVNDCIKNKDFMERIKKYKLNDLPISEDSLLCLAAYNMKHRQSSIRSKGLSYCQLYVDDSTKARIPNYDSPLSKSCKTDSDCRYLDTWDGVTDEISNSELVLDRAEYSPKCDLVDVCGFSAWNPGTPPTKLNAISSEISKNRLVFGKKTYWGECFIFASYITTLMRTLGIPCRQVSAFQVIKEYCKGLKDPSKCKTEFGDFTGIVNVKQEDDGKVVFNDNNIFFWNFHAWNEVWMKRPDLESTNYAGSGWQVVDSTPQELSEGFLQLGPVPLKSVKNGVLDIKYDSKFVHSEVNYLLNYDQNKVDKDKVDKDKLGLTPNECRIFTPNINMKYTKFLNDGTMTNMVKLIQDNIMQDITNQYRIDDKKARSVNKGNKNRINLVVKSGSIATDTVFNIKLFSLIDGTVKFTLYLFETFARGSETGNKIFQKEFSVQVKKLKEISFTYTINGEDINVKNTNYFKATVSAIYPSGEKLFDFKSVFLIPVGLTLVYKNNNLSIIFKNPYTSKALTGGELTISSETFNKVIKLKTIPPGQKITLSESVVFKKSSIVNCFLQIDQVKEGFTNFLLI